MSSLRGRRGASDTDHILAVGRGQHFSLRTPHMDGFSVRYRFTTDTVDLVSAAIKPLVMWDALEQHCPYLIAAFTYMESHDPPGLFTAMWSPSHEAFVQEPNMPHDGITPTAIGYYLGLSVLPNHNHPS